MKRIHSIVFLGIALLGTGKIEASVFTIGGFTFDDTNATRAVAIVEGPRNLKIESSRFGKFSSAYLSDATVRSNEFARFNRNASLGVELQASRSKAALYAKAVTLARGDEGHRSTIEITWGGNGLRNSSGADFVIYESGEPEPFAVSVLKNGSREFSRPRYQLPNSYDSAHESHAFAFDLRDFSIADGEMIQAIRIQNVVSSGAVDKVDTVSGQGMILSPTDKDYARGFPVLRKDKSTSKPSGPNLVYVAALRGIEPLEKTPDFLAPGLFTIGGFTFNQSNSVKRAFIVEGPANLKVRPSALFAPRANPRRNSVLNHASNFVDFDRSKTIGQLLRNNDGTARKGTGAMHVMFPDIESAPPTPNVDRCAIELNWDGATLHNSPGNDFVVYEVEHWEGFAVSVQKTGSRQWTPYRYQFPNSTDANHVVNAVAFDLSSFGLRADESIAAIRIRNLFNSKAAAGGDKVDNVSGQGMLLTSKDPNYRSGFRLLASRNGKDFTVDFLDADIVYVAGLHDIEPAERKIASGQ